MTFTKKLAFSVLAMAGIMATAGAASAAQILSDEVTTNIFINTNNGAAPGGVAEGEQFLTGAAPAGFSGWDALEFNWFTGTVDHATGNLTSGTSLTPEATGNLYILTQQYTGRPGGVTGLASVTAAQGLVAKSTGIVAVAGGGNAFTFAPGVELLANTEYYVYSDVDQNLPLVSRTTQGANFAEWQAPLGSSGSYFKVATNEALFDLTGTAVPEPATWAMMLLGFGGIGFMARAARRKTVTA